MIELARASIEHIDARIERVTTELDSLHSLRSAWERFLALHGESIHQPPADPGQSGAPSVAPVSGPIDPPAVSRSEAVTVPPGDGSPAIKQPGSARSGQSARRRLGRRAPADVAAPSTSLSGPVGTPTPASPLVDCPQCGETVKAQGLGSHQRKHKAGYTPPDVPTPAGTMATCPECEKEVKAMGLGTHRRQAHGRGRRTTLVKPPAEAKPARRSAPKTATPRVHPEGKVLCPSCKDWFVDAERLRAHRERSHGLRSDGHSESYLCNRCPAAFPTREERDAHATTHPSEPPELTVGHNPTTRRDGVPTGVPIA